MKQYYPVVFGLLVLVIIGYFSPLYGAPGSIKVYIKDGKTDDPLNEVTVTLVFQKNLTVRSRLESNIKGFLYKTGLHHGQYRVNCEKAGYIPEQTTVRIQPAQCTELDVFMKPLEMESNQSVAAILILAHKLMVNGKYSDAISNISKVIAKTPESFILYYTRAVAYEKSGEKDKAIEDYKKTVELKPDFLLPLSSLGYIYARRLEFRNAMEFYKKAFEMGCVDTLTLYNYGSCLINLEENQQAKMVFNKIVTLDPYYSEAYYHLGIISLGMDDHAQTKEYLNKFIELDPEAANAGMAKEILTSLE